MIASLGHEDAAWLHMDEPTNPMVVNGLLLLDRRVERGEVLRLLRERLAPFPRFFARVVRDRWEPVVGFDVAEHVDFVRLVESDEPSLRRFVSRVVSEQLDFGAPLWRDYVIERPDAPTAILCRVHHAVADGFALLRVLAALSDEGRVDVPGAAAAAHAAHAASASHAAWLARDAAYAASLAHLTFSPTDPRTRLRGRQSRAKEVAWCAPVPLAAVKKAAHALDATINDVLVAAVAGGVGRWLARRGDDARGRDVHALVPVNLRGVTSSLDELGNLFGLVLMALPVGEREARARVREVSRRMRRLKASPEALVAHDLLGIMGAAPQPVEDAGVSFFGRKASLVLTNVPGPRERLHFAGAAIDRVVFWVPQSGRVGLGVSLLSYAGAVTIGIVSDAALVADPEVLLADVEAELAASLAS